MSAYIVEKRHILYLVTAAWAGRFRFTWWHNETSHELPEGDYDRAAEVGNMLWQENIKSVSHRYPHESSATLPGPVHAESAITAADFPIFLEHDPAQVLKSCDCYEYQSCEHQEWKGSESFAFIDALRNRTWRRLPGYDKAVWGAPVENRRLVLLSAMRQS